MTSSEVRSWSNLEKFMLIHRQKVNIGKWVLRNLFLGFVREEQRIRRKRDIRGSFSHSNTRLSVGGTNPDPNGNSATGPLSPLEISRSFSRLPTCTTIVTSTSALPTIIPAVPSIAKPSPLLTPMIPLKTAKTRSSNSQPPSSDQPLTPRPIRTHGLDIPPPSGSREPEYFSARTRRPSTASIALSDGDFSGWGGPGSPPRHIGDSSGPVTPITPGGGLMGRLKTLGKGSGRRTANDIVPSSPITSNAGSTMDTLTLPEVQFVWTHSFDCRPTYYRITNLALQEHPLNCYCHLRCLHPHLVRPQLCHFQPT